ncbi:uncharacterized protein LOC132309722 [Cornus florida]|uniref:uncharacterized protein LOC132309722 n=1 Tax=Cornus florida TaxID=4283 RepID=UPI002898D5DC|nr:uncharacterized protein LOC132309722 [Cornus florida]
MSSASLPPTTFYAKMFLNSPPLIISEARNSYKPFFNLKKSNHDEHLPQTPYTFSVPHSPLSFPSLIQSNFYSGHAGLSLVTFGTNNQNSRSGEEDQRAVEAVLKLYAAIKNRNIGELSALIGEECRCICNFISAFQPFQGKNQVLYFFSSLMKYLGNNIEFVIKPVMDDGGMGVGVSWRLECTNTRVPLAKGFSFYMCHVYQGRVLIRNVEMFMEPLLHLEPLRLKITVSVMTIFNKLVSDVASKGKVQRAAYIFLTVFFMAASLFFSRFFLY